MIKLSTVKLEWRIKQLKMNIKYLRSVLMESQKSNGGSGGRIQKPAFVLPTEVEKAGLLLRIGLLPAPPFKEQEK